MTRGRPPPRGGGEQRWERLRATNTPTTAPSTAPTRGNHACARRRRRGPAEHGQEARCRAHQAPVRRRRPGQRPPTGDDEEDPVGDGGDGRVERAERVGEPPADLGGRVHREPDLLGHDDRRAGGAAGATRARIHLQIRRAATQVPSESTRTVPVRCGRRVVTHSIVGHVAGRRPVRLDPCRDVGIGDRRRGTNVTGSPSSAAIRSATSDLPERVPPSTRTITAGAPSSQPSVPRRRPVHPPPGAILPDRGPANCWAVPKWAQGCTPRRWRCRSPTPRSCSA